MSSNVSPSPSAYQGPSSVMRSRTSAAGVSGGATKRQAHVGQYSSICTANLPALGDGEGEHLSPCNCGAKAQQGVFVFQKIEHKHQAELRLRRIREQRRSGARVESARDSESKVTIAAVKATSPMSSPAPLAVSPEASTPAADQPLRQPLEGVAGISAARLGQLERLGLKTVGDLLFHFPRHYEDLTDLRKIAELSDGALHTVEGEVVEID